MKDSKFKFNKEGWFLSEDKKPEPKEKEEKYVHLDLSNLDSEEANIPLCKAIFGVEPEDVEDLSAADQEKLAKAMGLIEEGEGLSDTNNQDQKERPKKPPRSLH